MAICPTGLEYSTLTHRPGKRQYKQTRLLDNFKINFFRTKRYINIYSLLLHYITAEETKNELYLTHQQF